MLDDVAYEATTSTGHFAVTRTGTLIHRRAGGIAAEMTTLEWVDPTGKRAPLRATPGVYRDPSLSPDGTRIALVVTEGGSRDVWVYDLQRDVMTRLTFRDGGQYQYPRWSPEGRFVVFESYASTRWGIFQARADGASQPQALTQAKTTQIPWSFTPDGKRLAYFTGGTNQQIWTVPLEDQGGQLKAGTPEPFLKSRLDDVTPAFSPDGRWLAWATHASAAG